MSRYLTDIPKVTQVFIQKYICYKYRAFNLNPISTLKFELRHALGKCREQKIVGHAVKMGHIEKYEVFEPFIDLIFNYRNIRKR